MLHESVYVFLLLMLLPLMTFKDHGHLTVFLVASSRSVSSVAAETMAYTLARQR